jgi:hypothetical protein
MAGAAVVLSRFRVGGSHWAGVLVAEDGQLDLTDGLVDGNRVGRAVLWSLPVARLLGGVAYYDNEVEEARGGVVVPTPSLL